ncbi:MAG: hypothetical protein F6K42_25065 [Leptolyngbya sp. SIO1D8]|nr:hypothetical protein [Leptolyngbya sp. SIO1D8]
MASLEEMIAQEQRHLLEQKAIRENEWKAEQIRLAKNVKEILVGIGIPEESMEIHATESKHSVSIDHDGILEAFWEDESLCLWVNFPGNNNQNWTCCFSLKGDKWLPVRGNISDILDGSKTLQQYVAENAAKVRVSRQIAEAQVQEEKKLQAEAVARDRHLASTILKPEFLRCYKKAGPRPWPQGVTLTIYQITCCVGAYLANPGQLDAKILDHTRFDYRTVFTQKLNTTWNLFGNRFISAYSGGENLELLLHKWLFPQIKRLTFSSYSDLPVELVEPDSVLELEGTVESLAWDDLGYLVNRTGSNATRSPFEWNYEDSRCKRLIDGWADELALPMGAQPCEWILDILFGSEHESK